MKLNARALGTTVGAITTMFFLVCSILFRLVPGWYAKQYQLFMHVDLVKAGQPPGWGEILLGTLGWGLGTWFLAGLAAVLYNRLSLGASRDA